MGKAPCTTVNFGEAQNPNESETTWLLKANYSTPYFRNLDELLARDTLVRWASCVQCLRRAFGSALFEKSGTSLRE